MHSSTHIDDIDEFPTADDLRAEEHCSRKRHRPKSRQLRARQPRSDSDQPFKCGHCKQLIGAPLTGGRHRNHCPNCLCLYSRHVDRSHPGDRRSDCHALMAPLGVIFRRNGEQVIVHRCLGCGKEDPNRIAADDNPTLLLTLPPLARAGLTLVMQQMAEPSEEESA